MIAAIALAFWIHRSSLLSRSTRVTGRYTIEQYGFSAWLDTHTLIADMSSTQWYRPGIRQAMLVDVHSGKQRRLEPLCSYLEHRPPEFGSSFSVSPDGSSILCVTGLPAYPLWLTLHQGTVRVVRRFGDEPTGLASFSLQQGTGPVIRRFSGSPWLLTSLRSQWDPDTHAWRNLVLDGYNAWFDTATPGMAPLSKSGAGDGGIAIRGEPISLLPGHNWALLRPSIPAHVPVKLSTWNATSHKETQGVPVRFAPGCSELIACTVSPDGKQLAWVFRGEQLHNWWGGFLHGVLRLPVRSSEVRSIVVTDTRGGSWREVGHETLPEVTPLPSDDSSGWISEARWLPDSTHLSFFYNGGIYTVPVDR